MDSYWEVFSYVQLPFAACSSSPDLQYIVFSELGKIAFLAFAQRAMQSGVVAVLLCGSPSKIVDVIVRLTAIQMPAHLPIWAWSDKRREHKCVYKHLSWTTIVTKVDDVVTSFACQCLDVIGVFPWYGYAMSVAMKSRQDDSRIVNRVSWISRNYTKAFGDGIIRIRHCSVPSN